MFSPTENQASGFTLKAYEPRSTKSRSAPIGPVAWASQRDKRGEASRQKAIAAELANPTALLFDEALRYLSQPLVSRSWLPKEYRDSDRFLVALQPETGDEVDPDIWVDIPMEAAWGPAWVVSAHRDCHSQKAEVAAWSRDALGIMQHQLLWISMLELANTSNPAEKWSVLRWIFMPAIRKFYVYDKRISKSHCLLQHENEYAYSFHKCCMAAGVNEDVLRDGIRRHLSAELISAIERVCTFPS